MDFVFGVVVIGADIDEGVEIDLFGDEINAAGYNGGKGGRMKERRVVFALVALVIMVVMVGPLVGKAAAAFFDRDKLARALAVRFNLNEREVASFLADFQYHPDDYPTATTTSTPTPTPTPTPSPALVVKNGIEYQYDDGTDEYYPAAKIVNIQHRNHLSFIEEKLDAQVEEGRLTRRVEREILSKLAEMMAKSPSSQEFRRMGIAAQRAAIAKFKNEMDAWMRKRGMTLAQLSEMTGKGNKYLMGIYLD